MAGGAAPRTLDALGVAPRVYCWWNGEQVPARRVLVQLGGLGEWFVYAVEVRASDPDARAFPFYIDDHDGRGWHKVTADPTIPHRFIDDVRVVRELPLDEPCLCGFGR